MPMNTAFGKIEAEIAQKLRFSEGSRVGKWKFHSLAQAPPIQTALLRLSGMKSDLLSL
jgi:hypothetical protein